MLQWNDTGLRTRFVNYKHWFTIETQPFCVFKKHIYVPPSQHSWLYSLPLWSHGDRANGVTAIFTRNYIYSAIFQLQTTLQAVTAHKSWLTLGFTVCNIDLPPSVPVPKAGLTNFVTLFPPPFLKSGILMQNILWGSEHFDDKITIAADTCARFN